jgi:hypothetical protein
MRRLIPWLFVLCCSCERRPQQWAAKLGSPDAFNRFLAAVALAHGGGQVPARAVSELVRVTQSPDAKMRATATRVLERHHDQAVWTFFTLLDETAMPGQQTVTWTGSEFEFSLLDRLAPDLKHPSCSKHVAFCEFVGNLPQKKRRGLIRLDRERKRGRAGR